MSQETDIQALLRDGIEAARAGNKTAAREIFEQVVELDENNERAWYWMASVVETDEERRVCLANVLVINPDNEKARKLMDKLEERKREVEAEEEVIPGVSRRQLTLILGGGGALIAVIALIVLGLVISSNNARNTEIAAQTRVMADLTASVFAIGVTQTAAEDARIALEGTSTPTPLVLATLPPTFTPTVTDTPGAEDIVLPPPPSSMGGTLAVWGGRDVLSNGAFEVLTIPLNNLERIRAGDQYGKDVRFADSSQRLIFTRYFSPTFSFGIEAVNNNGTQSIVTQENPQVYELEQPDRCPSANLITFTGIPQRAVDITNLQSDKPPTQIFTLDRDTETFTLVTLDEATYYNPAFSPDCTKIAAVRDDKNSANAGPDIVLIDIASGSFTPVTTDLTTYAESNPRWSPDGRQIIFSARPSNDPENSDIILVNADGTGAPFLPNRSPASEILPVFSPDGQYFAYSSNVKGSYNIYIFGPANNETYQVTNSLTDGDFFVGDWR